MSSLRNFLHQVHIQYYNYIVTVRVYLLQEWFWKKSLLEEFTSDPLVRPNLQIPLGNNYA